MPIWIIIRNVQTERLRRITEKNLEAVSRMDGRGQLSSGTANVGRARLAWTALLRTGPCGGEVNVAPKDAIAAQ